MWTSKFTDRAAVEPAACGASAALSRASAERRKQVLSPSAERYDREEKFAHYRRAPSLAAYVLISQEEQRLEVFSRNDDGSWTLREARSGTVDLKAIGCRLAVNDVYRKPLGV